jgi:hypothetical protein
MSTPLSRREILTLLMGASLGTWACKRYSPRTYAGRVVGGDKAFGHRTIGHGLVDASVPVEDAEIVIVGSGIAGLSAAWRLERQRQPRYVVLELESLAGGTSCYGTDGVVPYPWAAHYIPVPDSGNHSLRTLLDEIGAFESDDSGIVQPAESMLVRAPDERLFIDNRWVPGLLPTSRMNAADRQEFLRFQGQVNRWAAFRDGQGRRAFTLPLDRCSTSSPWMEFDSLSAAQWLRREGYRSPSLRWWLEYGCRDDYGCTLETTSAWAMMLYHAARVPDAGVPSAPFLTWPEGNGRLVRHFETIIGSRLRRRQLATGVRPRPHGADVEVLRSDGSRYVLRAGYVILAVPRFVARHLVVPWREQPPAWHDAFSYAPWMVANLHIKNRPTNRGFDLAWDNVLYDSPSLGYVVATHQALIDDGPSVLTYYMPFTDDDPKNARERLAAGDHASLCDAIVSDLRRAHPDLPDLVSRIDVWRWGHAMIRPTPGLIWGGKRDEARKPMGQIHFAHTDLSGLALFEEAHAHGVRAADEVMDQMRRVL